MIERIEIKNFALARDVTVILGPGLNVFTGETGAGKSLVVDALAFCLGARRGVDVIPSGAERAEARVVLADGRCVERTIGLNGRSAARLDGSLVAVDAIRELTAGRVEIHGQADQLALLRSSVQLSALDRFGGCTALAGQFAAAARSLRDTRRDLSTLRTDARQRERRADQLRFEVTEIEAAKLSADEPGILEAERARLSSTAARRSAAQSALASLDSFAIGDLVGTLGQLAGDDPDAGELLAAATLLEATAADLSRALRRYWESIEEDPARLYAVEERLDLIFGLRRKYGETAAEILAYGEAAAEELAGLERRYASEDELVNREAELLQRLSELGFRLSQRRRKAAARLAAGVREELGRLGMGGAAFAVGFACSDAVIGVEVALPDYEVIGGEGGRVAASTDPVGRVFTESGVDQVEFLVSFNPGESPRPLAVVASGGETSRFLLALTAVFGNDAEPQTIVLDEADEGVGGRSGALVGDALRRLAARHQVLCVTHLPQVAALAQRHFVVSKVEGDGGLIASSCRELSEPDRVDELAAMLGGKSEATVRAAKDLLGGAG